MATKEEIEAKKAEIIAKGIGKFSIFTEKHPKILEGISKINAFNEKHDINGKLDKFTNFVNKTSEFTNELRDTFTTHGPKK